MGSVFLLGTSTEVCHMQWDSWAELKKSEVLLTPLTIEEIRTFCLKDFAELDRSLWKQEAEH